MLRPHAGVCCLVGLRQGPKKFTCLISSQATQLPVSVPHFENQCSVLFLASNWFHPISKGRKWERELFFLHSFRIFQIEWSSIMLLLFSFIYIFSIDWLKWSDRNNWTLELYFMFQSQINSIIKSNITCSIFCMVPTLITSLYLKLFKSYFMSVKVCQLSSRKRLSFVLSLKSISISFVKWVLGFFF